MVINNSKVKVTLLFQATTMLVTEKNSAHCFASSASTVKLTSSKNCCVRRRMCLSSVSSRKFFFRASWFVFISFSSFSSFSNVACGGRHTERSAEGGSRRESSWFTFKRESSHLQVDHVPWKGDFRVLSCVNYWDVGLLYFFFHKSCEIEVTR